MMTVAWLNGYKVECHAKAQETSEVMATADLPGIRTIFGWVATDHDKDKAHTIYVRGHRATLWRVYTILLDPARVRYAPNYRSITCDPKAFVTDAIRASEGWPRRIWQ